MDNNKKIEIIDLMRRTLSSDAFKEDYIGVTNATSNAEISTYLQTSNVVFANTAANNYLFSLYTGNETLNVVRDFDLLRLMSGQFVDKNGANIAISPCTWQNTPAAVGNTGLIVPVTNLSNSAYDLMISNGTRFYPLKGSINLKALRTTQFVLQRDSNITNANIVSLMKLTIPYSTINGSVMRPGDIIEYKLVHDRSSVATISLFRLWYVGSNSSNVLNNTILEQRTNALTADGTITEHGEMMLVSNTSMNMAGRKNSDQWSGPSATSLFTANDTVTGLPNFDSNNMYIDMCLRWNSNSSADSANLHFARAILHCTGPFDG